MVNTSSRDTASGPAESSGRSGAALLIIFLTVFIDLVGFGIIIPVLQPFAKDALGATDLQAGLLMGVFSMVQFFVTPIWGWLSDRFGRKPILLLTLLGMSFSYLILAWADRLWMLFAGRALAGLFAGNIAVAQAYVADVTPPEKRAHGMGLIGAAFGLGFVLGPTIGGILAGRYSFATPSYAAAGASGAAFLFGALVLKESLPKFRRTESRKLRHPVFGIAKFVSERAVFSVILANFFWTTTFSMWETVFVLFLAANVYPGISGNELAAQVGYLFAAMGLLSAFIQGGLIRRLVKAFPEDRLARIGIWTYIAGSFGFLLYLVPLNLEGSVAALSPFLFLIAVGQAFLNPTLSAIVSKLVGPDRQGETIGSFRGIGSLGRVVGPPLGAVLFAGVWHGAPYLAGVVLLGVAHMLMSRQFHYHKAVPDPASGS